MAGRDAAEREPSVVDSRAGYNATTGEIEDDAEWEDCKATNPGGFSMAERYNQSFLFDMVLVDHATSTPRDAVWVGKVLDVPHFSVTGRADSKLRGIDASELDTRTGDGLPPRREQAGPHLPDQRPLPP